jgi:hypothetical protein
MFPCAGRRSEQGFTAVAQVNGTLGALHGAGVGGLVGTLWLDIETNPSSGCGWSSDLASNCAWIQELVDAARAAGQHVGIYASHFEWGQVAGAACTLKKSHSEVEPLPMWYAHYDHDASTCSDYDSALKFGGWTTPFMKQYDDHLPAGCAIGADVSIKCGNPGPGPSPGPSPSPEGGCQSYQTGLCSGGNNCMCTTGSTCGGENVTAPLNFTHQALVLSGKVPVGACSGECRTVIHGECAGPNSCMKSSGPC